MSSRDDILTSIRANLPRVDRPLPHVPPFDDEPPASLLSAFKVNLHRMGGVFLDPPTTRDLIHGAQGVRSLSVPPVAREVSNKLKRQEGTV